MKYHHIHFQTIDSTNTFLKNNYEKYDSFTFVSSDYQSSGKGRNDRKWVADEGKNILMSFILKEDNILSDFPFISIGTAYVIAQYLQDIEVKNVSIKWPNDIYVNDKKICGILLESSLPRYLVVGLGLNLNQREFLDEYRITPTSAANELGKELDKITVSEELIQRLTAFMSDIRANISHLKEFITSHNYLLNKRVKVNDIEGIVVGIDETNALLINENGVIKQINSGEINISLQN